MAERMMNSRTDTSVTPVATLNIAKTGLSVTLKTVLTTLLVMGTVMISLAQESSIPAEETTENQQQEPPLETTSSIVYKSIDATGRVSYSDQPNPDALREEQVTLPSYPKTLSPEQSQAHRENMIATTARLQADRRARENARRRDSERKTPPAVQYPQVIVQNRVYRRPSYYDRAGYGHTRSRRDNIYPYPDNHSTHHKHSSVGINIQGGSSKFRYGVSLGSQQEHHRSRSVRTPYRRQYWSEH